MKYITENINLKDIYGNTPLIKSAIAGNKYLVEAFVNWGADPKIKNNEDKNAYDLAKTKFIKEYLFNLTYN